MAGLLQDDAQARGLLDGFGDYLKTSWDMIGYGARKAHAAISPYSVLSPTDIASFAPGGGLTQAAREDFPQAIEAARGGDYGSAATHALGGTMNTVGDLMWAGGPLLGATAGTLMKGGANALDTAKAVRQTAPELEKVLHSRAASLYNLPDKPLRPFEADYPRGAKTDGSGRILETIEGSPLGARYIVGRRFSGEADARLPEDALDTITEAITGRGASAVPQGSEGLGRNDFGGTSVNRYSRRPLEVFLSDKLTPGQLPGVFSHEVGHVVDQAAGEIPINGFRREADQLYNTLNTGRERTTNLMGPGHVGYKDGDIPRELMAEGIRAYMQDPNAMKTVAPKMAAAIRKAVNDHPELSKIIQFNGIGALGILGATGQQDGEKPNM